MSLAKKAVILMITFMLVCACSTNKSIPPELKSFSSNPSDTAPNAVISLYSYTNYYEDNDEDGVNAENYGNIIFINGFGRDHLDGGSSYDPSGSILSYQWTMKSKPAGSRAILMAPEAVNSYFEPDAYGKYLIELVVSNQQGEVSSPVNVTIEVGNITNEPSDADCSTVSSPCGFIVRILMLLALVAII